MRKNMFEKVVLLFLSLSVCFVFSACEMFTASWGKGVRRNQQDFLKKASASELLAFFQGANASSPETVKAVLNLLSEKSTAELKNLDLSDKEAALNLTLDATLPMKKISQIASDIDSLTGNASGATADQFMRKLLNDTDTFDTTASVQLLSDRTAMEKADPNILANAAVAVIVQVAAKNGYDNIKAKIGSGGVAFDLADNANSIVNKMLGTDAAAIGTTDDRKALTAAVNVAMLLSGGANAQDSEENPVTRPGLDPKKVKLLGAVPLKDILKAF